MTMRVDVLLALSVVMTACAGASSPPKSASDAEEQDEASDVTADLFADGSEAGNGGEGDDSVRLVPCAGKDATFWENGAMKSQVLTSECTFDGKTYPAGTLMEFDKNGVLLPGS